MADRLGQAIAPGTLYVLAGVLRRQDGTLCVVVPGSTEPVRISESETFKLDEVIVRDGSRYFTGPIGGTAAPTIPEHYVRNIELTASQAAQDAIFLAVLAGYLPLSAVTAFTLTLLDDANAGAARTTLGLAALAVLNTVGTAQIDNDAATNAKLADMAQATIKGRASGAGTGDPTDLTAAQVATIIAATGTFAPMAHTHLDEEIAVDKSMFSGSLAGWSGTTLEELLLYIDANLS